MPFPPRNSLQHREQSLTTVPSACKNNSNVSQGSQPCLQRSHEARGVQDQHTHLHGAPHGRSQVSLHGSLPGAPGHRPQGAPPGALPGCPSGSPHRSPHGYLPGILPHKFRAPYRPPQRLQGSGGCLQGFPQGLLPSCPGPGPGGAWLQLETTPQLYGHASYQQLPPGTECMNRLAPEFHSGRDRTMSSVMMSWEGPHTTSIPRRHRNPALTARNVLHSQVGPPYP